MWPQGECANVTLAAPEVRVEPVTAAVRQWLDLCGLLFLVFFLKIVNNLSDTQ